MKTYNTLANAINMSIAQNGDPDTWQVEYNIATKTAFEKYLAPYLKIVKSCTYANRTDCMPPSESYKKLSGDLMEPREHEEYEQTRYIVLADGATVMLHAGSYDQEFNFFFDIDVNGKKGPNTLGRDYFSLFYGKIDGGYYDSTPARYVLVPGDEYESGDGELDEYGVANDNCSAIKGSSGEGCAARLLKEGAMNY